MFLGVYSLCWETLGQCLYTTSFEQNAVSVSLSPTNRHLMVGLASRQSSISAYGRQSMAQILRMDDAHTLAHVRDIEQGPEHSYMSLNCIRWAPRAGQGLVYGTNTGQLRILR